MKLYRVVIRQKTKPKHHVLTEEKVDEINARLENLP
jgi:hypothetical protein